MYRPATEILTMSKNHHNPVVPVSGRRFEILAGRLTTVRDPRPIEMQGLVAKYKIKPWTNPEERAYLQADVQAAQQSLRHVA